MKLPSNPITLFESWYSDALNSAAPQPDAMVLATATPNGVPSARVVLYKGLNPQGICFYTHYRSRKGKELARNPKAAIVFYWPELNRQVRIEGRVKQVSATESDAYWNSRPKESRIGALASPQSTVIPNRETLEKRFTQLKEKYPGHSVPRPSTWGGYVLIPNRIEFWTLGAHRLHDRFCYQRQRNSWKHVRLAP